MGLHDPRPAVVERFLLDDFAHTLRMSADLARKVQAPCDVPAFAEPSEDAWRQDVEDREDYFAMTLGPITTQRRRLDPAAWGTDWEREA